MTLARFGMTGHLGQDVLPAVAMGGGPDHVIVTKTSVITLKLWTVTIQQVKDQSVTSWDKTSDMLQNMKLHKLAFYLKMSKYVYF